MALAVGVLTSLMITANGGLTEFVGLYSSSIIVHVVGLLILSVVMIIKKVNPFKNIQPWYLYLGGVLGVLVTVGTSYAFEPLGVSATLALGLLGQSTMGLLIDQFGIFGMQTYKFKKMRLIPFIVMILGAVFMIRQLNIVAMILSFLIGSALVVQRVINGRLAKNTNLIISTSCTYIVGLLGSIVVFFILGRSEPVWTELTMPTNVLLYLGGLIGIFTVLLSTVCVSKMSSYGLSILIFIGQVFSGVIIDSVLIGEVAMINIIGGIIVTVGLCIDALVNKK